MGKECYLVNSQALDLSLAKELVYKDNANYRFNEDNLTYWVNKYPK